MPIWMVKAMTKEFSKKVKNEIRPALFGTDFHSKECWFCWRRPFGCPGVLFKVVATPKFIKGFMLYLPDGYSEKDGVWRKHTRAQFRHPQLTRAAAETRRDRVYWESRREDYLNSGVDRSSKTFDYLKEDLSLIEKRATYLKEVKREDGAKVLNAEYITSHKLPTLIACPSCGCTNSVSKLRGPIEVKQGVIVK